MPSLYQLTLLCSASALASAGTLSVSLQRRDSTLEHLGAVAGNILKRATSTGPVALYAVYNSTGYFSQLGVGTPSQNLVFHLDTGSSDTWLNSRTSSYCSNPEQQLRGPCSAAFDAGRSSTARLVERDGLLVEYADGTNASGDYFSDTVTINGRAVLNQQLGLASRSQRPWGIMGLGPSSGVASRTRYATVVDNMVAQGIIDHPTFSLYFNGLDSRNGTVLFGGIDSSKYYDNLVTVPLRTFPNGKVSYTVNLRGIAVSGVRLPAVAASSVALLDCGSTISIFPETIAAALDKKYGVVRLKQGDNGLEVGLVDCNLRGDQGKDSAFKFSFEGDKDIFVPLKEMVVDSLPDADQSELKNSNRVPAAAKSWGRICLWGVMSTSSVSQTLGQTGDDLYILGDTFLRSAYSVFDTANNQVGLAQANVGADTRTSNVIAMDKGAKSFPPVSGAKAPNFPDTSGSTEVMCSWTVSSLVAALVTVYSVV